MSQRRGQLEELDCAGIPFVLALGARSRACCSAWVSEGLCLGARRTSTFGGGSPVIPEPLGQAPPSPPGTGGGRGGAGGVGRERAVLSARCRPSRPAGPPARSTPLGSSHRPQLSLLLFPAARCAVRPEDRGLAIGARWAWR